MDTIVTTAPAIVREGMSLDDFQRQQDQAPFELIEGEIETIMSPKIYQSDEIAWIIHLEILKAGGDGSLGFAYVETTFVLPEPSATNWVKGSRQPDIMYYEKSRLMSYRKAQSNYREVPLGLVPDLAVEIVSPTDRLPKVWRKAAVYLEDGVRLVCVVNPMKKSITVFTNEQITLLEGTAALTGGNIMPGLTIPLDNIFKILES